MVKKIIALKHKTKSNLKLSTLKNITIFEVVNDRL